MRKTETINHNSWTAIDLFDEMLKYLYPKPQVRKCRISFFQWLQALFKFVFMSGYVKSDEVRSYSTSLVAYGHGYCFS